MQQQAQQWESFTECIVVVSKHAFISPHQSGTACLNVAHAPPVQGILQLVLRRLHHSPPVHQVLTNACTDEHRPQSSCCSWQPLAAAPAAQAAASMHQIDNKQARKQWEESKHASD